MPADAAVLLPDHVSRSSWRASEGSVEGVTILTGMLIDALEWLGPFGLPVARTGATIYIDPYRVLDGVPKADLILITHGHYDHFSPQDVERLSRRAHLARGARRRWRSGRRAGDLDRAGRGGRAGARARRRGAGGGGVQHLQARRRGQGLPPARGRLASGYDLNVRGERLYHAGDTDVIPEMDAVAGVDVALLPVSGTYVMTAGEAAEAARRIQPRVAVPMHWGEQAGMAVRGGRSRVSGAGAC